MSGVRIKAMAGLMLLAGCGSTATSPADMPEPPAAIAPVDRNPWGDTVLAGMGALARAVDDQMRPRFGTAQERQHVASDRAALDGLEGWYRQRLGNEWQPVPLRFLSGQAGFGFASGDRAIVVAWIDPVGDGRVPVTTFTYPRKP